MPKAKEKVEKICIGIGLFLFKSSSKDEVYNYRPVALLPCTSKIFEQCLNDGLLDVIDPQLSD